MTNDKPSNLWTVALLIVAGFCLYRILFRSKTSKW
jgi:hypothetical protein